MPTHNYGTNPETLLVLAWCSTLNLEELAQKDRQARPHRYPGPREDWLPVFPANMLKEQITKATSCLQDDPYGPVLRDLVSYRLLFVDIEEVAHTISIKDLTEASHGLFSTDHPFVNYTIEKQREKGPASETDVFLQTVSKHASLQERLLQLSQIWSGNVCLGAESLRIFFGYSLMMLWHLEAPFFVGELLRMSLQQVDWHSVAACVLGFDTFSCSSEHAHESNVQLHQELLTPLAEEIWQSNRTFKESLQRLTLLLSSHQEEHDWGLI